MQEHQARRGAGRTLATMMAAQLWAKDTTVALFYYEPSGSAQVCAWLYTLSPDVRDNIAVFPASSMDGVKETLRGRRFGKIFVDHYIVELAEADLERQIQALRKSLADQLKNKETIR